MIDMSFAQKIRKLRKMKGWTIYDLAKQTLKSAGYISQIEGAGAIPGPPTTIILAVVLGVKPEELIELAKKEKSEEASQRLQRKYDDALARYQQRIKTNNFS